MSSTARTTFLMATLAVYAAAFPAHLLAQQKNPPAGPRLDTVGDPLPPGMLARMGTVRLTNCYYWTFSPDGKTIAALEDEAAVLWDAATGKEVRRLPVSERSPSAIVYSNDGTRLAVVGWQGRWIDVWETDAFAKRELGRRAGIFVDRFEVYGLPAAFSADGKTFVTMIGMDGFSQKEAAFLHWDVAAGKQLRQVPIQFDKGKQRRTLGEQFVFSPDGKVAANYRTSLGSSETTIIRIWDTQTGAKLHEIDGKEVNKAMYVVFSADGSTMAVACLGKQISLWSVATGKLLHAFMDEKPVGAIAFSADGKSIASLHGSWLDGPEKIIQIRNLADPSKPPQKLTVAHADRIMFSPDGKKLACRVFGESLCLLDVATGKDLLSLPGHRGPVEWLSFLPDGKTVVSSGADGSIRTWDAARGKELRALSGADVHKFFRALALSPRGKLLLSRPPSLVSWDVASGKEDFELKEMYAGAAAFSPDGNCFAVARGGVEVELRESATGKLIESLSELKLDSGESLAFSPDGKTLALARLGRQKLYLVELATKKLREVDLKPGRAERKISTVAFAPNGLTLAACGGPLLIFDTDLKLLKKLRGKSIFSRDEDGQIAYSADSRYLAWVDSARDIAILDPLSGSKLHSIKSPFPVLSVAFSPDGKTLAAGNRDGTISIWDLTALIEKIGSK